MALEGVYTVADVPRFVSLPPPTNEEVQQLLKLISQRIVRYFARRGYFIDDENPYYLDHNFLEGEEPTLSTCVAASIRYRIALGERAGLPVRRLGTLEECFGEEAKLEGERCATLGGFSLHANVACETNEKQKLEKLCRYVARPAISQERLGIRKDGLLVYKLKKPYSDGTQYLLFSPMELMEKLAALVPRPRLHVVRYHGVFAPHCALRNRIVLRPKAEQPNQDDAGGKNPSKMTWAQLLKRVFKVDMETCPACGGKVKVLSAILEEKTIEKILGHLDYPTKPPLVSPARPPPQFEFDEQLPPESNDFF